MEEVSAEEDEGSCRGVSPRQNLNRDERHMIQSTYTKRSLAKIAYLADPEVILEESIRVQRNAWFFSVEIMEIPRDLPIRASMDPGYR